MTITPHLGLPLPDPSGTLEVDVTRIADAFRLLDAKLKEIDTLLASDDLDLDTVQELVDALKSAQSELDVILGQVDARFSTLVAGYNQQLQDMSTAIADGLAQAGDVTLTGAQTLTHKTLKNCATAYHNAGATNAIDYENGSVQRWAPATGAQTLSVTHWPESGVLGELLIEGLNLGAATLTFPAQAVFIKNDGSESNFASSGVKLKPLGTDWLYLWTVNAGEKIYIKVLR